MFPFISLNAGVRRALFLLACTAGPAGATHAPPIASPDGRLVATFGGPVKNNRGLSEGIATWSLAYQGQQLIKPSVLDLRLSLAKFSSAGFRFVGASPAREVRATYRPVVGKTASASDHYRETTLTYEDLALPGRQVDVLVRMYDSGAALRYVIKGRPGEKLTLTKEVTTFDFAADFACWGFNQGQWSGYHEGEFDPLRASALRDSHLFSLPLVCKPGVGETSFALTESDVRDYPVTFLSGRGNGNLGAELKHPVRTDTGSGVRQDAAIANVVLAPGGFATPWRVVMVGASPRALAESSLVQMLAAPSVIKDTAWIKPGKVAWDWWNGSQVDIANPGMNTATYKAFIDFAAEMGLGYVLIDEGWSVGSSIDADARADVTRAKPEMDMAAIVAYANARKVGVMLWVQWEQLDRQMDRALALYQRWGIKGIKVDFMKRNDQDMVRWYHRLLGKAADKQLLVDLHGGFPAVGLERTYPNLLTQEAVMGAEFNKWSTRVNATHNVTLPFTRMILGPMDYTPGGFRHVAPAGFTDKVRWLNPVVQTTRGHALGMYVVYDSPLQMVADSPSAYRKSDGSWADGVDFLRQVPVTWDETRVVQGDIGQFIVTARRSGADWYIGAMSNEAARALRVPLDFLGEGKFAARVWQDGAAPDQLTLGSSTVDRTSTLDLALAGSGGAAVLLNRIDAR